MKEREFTGMTLNSLAVKTWSGQTYWDTFKRYPHQQFPRFNKDRAIIARSLDQYGTPRGKVERRIARWMRGLADKPLSPPLVRRKR
jgi:hypothetical protein